ncbi:MAG: hypothetical protein WCB57_15955 [Pseudonocardiaceae bacterium]
MTYRVVPGTQTVIIAGVVHSRGCIHKSSAPDLRAPACSTMLVVVAIEELADSRDGVLTLDEACAAA